MIRVEQCLVRAANGAIGALIEACMSVMPVRVRVRVSLALMISACVM